MSKHRLYTPQSLAINSNITLEKTAFHYVSTVLRLKKGDPITLFNGNSYEYRAIIEQQSSSELSLHISSEHQPLVESPIQLHLAQAISRGERMDYAIQKAVELGAHSIAPLFTERCEVKLNPARLIKKQQHWKNICISAAEQSGRCVVPCVHPPQTLSVWLESNTIAGFILNPYQVDPINTTEKPKALSLLIGPEGGFSDSECSQANHCQLKNLKLGPRILRTETATVAALTYLQTLFGDFNGTRQ